MWFYLTLSKLIEFGVVYSKCIVIRLEIIFSENEGVCTLFFFLGNLLEVLIDDCNGEEDTCSWSNSSHKICENWQSTNTASTEGGSSWDVSVQVFDHRVFSESFNDEILVHELSCNVSGARSWDIDPNSGEEGTWGQDEYGVDEGVDWVLLDVIKALWRTDVVCKSTNWCLMSSHVVVLPFSEESNDEVSSELTGKDLSEEVNVWNECGLQNDWNVWGIEKLDWVWLLESSHFSAAQAEFNSPSLEVDNDEHNNDGGDQVAKVWSVLPVECLLESIEFVWLGKQEMESGNNSSLEFGSLISSNGDWREWFPEDSLADVGGDKEWNTWSKSIALLEKLIEHKNHESSKEELSNDQNGSDKSKFSNWSVHAWKKISKCFTESNKKAEKFLRCLEELSVLFALHVDVNDFGTYQKLHNHAWSNDGAHTQLHNCSLVGSKNDT